MAVDGQEKKAAKKEQPKKEQPAKKKEEAAPAAEAPPAPKPKDPLDALPAGNFVMDDFKRFYSNNDEEKSVPYFWEKFDPDHYSIWYCEYK
ncbi:Elongation factor 1-gamma [Portunus trituberculatus]|uniref:Elongation factor 1-gamma n=1 Tax=Portunus trituberculatus TaxID=210409 RepID=A0A5B7DN08_PORTR|nr:Elongation factor 1-gamma [Portunus trituberculatus]